METKREKLVKAFFNQQNSAVGGAGGEGKGGAGGAAGSDSSGFNKCSVCGFEYIYYGVLSDNWCKNCEKFEILENRLISIEKALSLMADHSASSSECYQISEVTKIGFFVILQKP